MILRCSLRNYMKPRARQVPKCYCTQIMQNKNFPTHKSPCCGLEAKKRVILGAKHGELGAWIQSIMCLCPYLVPKKHIQIALEIRSNTTLIIINQGQRNSLNQNQVIQRENARGVNFTQVSYRSNNHEFTYTSDQPATELFPLL